MHRLTDRIFDISNAFHNTNVPVHERLCVSLLPYYLNWFEKYYPNVPLNRYEGPFCLQCMNEIQGGKSSGRKWNRLLDAVVITLKYNKITIDRAIFVKVFSD